MPRVWPLKKKKKDAQTGWGDRRGIWQSLGSEGKWGGVVLQMGRKAGLSGLDLFWKTCGRHGNFEQVE